MEAEGRIGDALALPASASKGKSGGRVLPLHRDTKSALERLLVDSGTTDRRAFVVHFAKGSTTKTTRSATVQWLFRQWYRSLGYHGCSSHSGRRFFITACAKNISRVGGTLRDVQMLAGHSSLQNTQRYIHTDPEAARRLVELL